MTQGMSTRVAVSVALNMNLDKPVKVRLSLGDDRVVGVDAWGTNDEGGLLLVLRDDHDFFPVGRYVIGAHRDEVVPILPSRSASTTGSPCGAPAGWST